MKSISLNVSEKSYQELKSVAARRGRPVAELIREAMADYLERERGSRRSVLDIDPHRSGRLRKRWSRSELLDEMLER
jgi:hypothetical protein